MSFCQLAVPIDKTVKEHIFQGEEILCYEDTTNRLTITDFIKHPDRYNFTAPSSIYPRTDNKEITYWYKVKLNYGEAINDKQLLEFFDQTVNHITVFLPDAQGNYIAQQTGANLAYNNRLFAHKNFEFKLPTATVGEKDIYFKVQSYNPVNVILVYRTVAHFIGYALNEYFTFGLFYGMIIIFSLNNLLMYFSTRKQHYIFYGFYLLAVALFEMSTDGIAFQYLWPQQAWWNLYASGFFLSFVSIFALLFTKAIFDIPKTNKKLNTLINIAIYVRILFVFICFFFAPQWFYLKVLEIIPLTLAFATGLWYLRVDRNKTAKYFVLGYSFLFLGFFVKVLFALGLARFLPSLAGHYSVSIGFILEMICLSFAITEYVRSLRRQQQKAQEEIITQLKLNEDLQKEFTDKLESKVKLRAAEVLSQAQELAEKNALIQAQNKLLNDNNKLLEERANDILHLNKLLEIDNKTLKTDIDRVTSERTLAQEISAEEFMKTYGDKEACYQLLASIKWKDKYKCLKCGHDNYCNGKTPYSRRCTKCSYEESVLYNTLFENVRIPIHKAFYLVYLVDLYKGDISSYKLAEKLQLRQSTCWSYATKVKNRMNTPNAKKEQNNKGGWTSLLVQ